MDNLLTIKDLSVTYPVNIKGERTLFKAISDVTLSINCGEMIAVIGESGSGKSTLASAILNLIQSPGQISSGSIIYKEDADLLKLSNQDYTDIRWSNLATVFQAAQNSLNPITTIHDHFYETWNQHYHGENSDETFDKRVNYLLNAVRLDKDALSKYSFELSGGMKQRILIALSMLLNPSMIILDEPTTALDVINQWYILEILKEINLTEKVSLIFLTHDISIISNIVDRIVVMYGGKVVEVGTKEQIINAPLHPYTKHLINSVPSLYDTPVNNHGDVKTNYDIDYSGNICNYYRNCPIKESVNCNGEIGKDLIEHSDKQSVLCLYGGFCNE